MKEIDLLFSFLPIRDIFTGNFLFLNILLISLIFISIFLRKIKVTIIFSIVLFLNFLAVLFFQDLKSIVLSTIFLNYFLFVFFFVLFFTKIKIKKRLGSNKEISYPNPHSKEYKLDFLAILFILLILIFSISPILLEKKTLSMGADTFYHLSILNKYDLNLDDMALIEGTKNHYGPIFYINNLLISSFFDISNLISSNILYPLYFFIILFLFYLFIRIHLGSKMAFISLVIFASLNLNREYVPNLLSFLFFLLFLFILSLNKLYSKKKILLLIFLAILLFHTHYLITLILLITFFCIIFFKYFLRRYEIYLEEDKKTDSLQIIFIFIYFLFYAIYYIRIESYLIELNPLYWDIFNLVVEIPLFPMSPFLPIILFGTYFYLSSKEWRSLNISSQSLFYSFLILFSNTLFYYFNLFQFHMRYFAEFSLYLFFVPLSSFYISSLINKFDKRAKITLLLLVIILITPFVTLSNQRFVGHIANSNNYAEKITEEFRPFLFSLEDKNSKNTFLINPCNFLNRYLPYIYSSVRIYSANYYPNEYCNSNIITTFSKKLEDYGLVNIDERNNKSYSLFLDPKPERLERITEGYDYLIINTKDYEIKREDWEKTLSANNLSLKYSTPNYLIFKKN